MSVTKHTQNIRIGITKGETYILSTLAKEGKTIIDLEDIIRVSNASYNYAKVIADRLRKKKCSFLGTSLNKTRYDSSMV